MMSSRYWDLDDQEIAAHNERMESAVGQAVEDRPTGATAGEAHHLGIRPGIVEHRHVYLAFDYMAGLRLVEMPVRMDIALGGDRGG